jgi:hypothetical protein
MCQSFEVAAQQSGIVAQILLGARPETAHGHADTRATADRARLTRIDLEHFLPFFFFLISTIDMCSKEADQ